MSSRVMRPAGPSARANRAGGAVVAVLLAVTLGGCSAAAIPSAAGDSPASATPSPIESTTPPAAPEPEAVAEPSAAPAAASPVVGQVPTTVAIPSLELTEPLIDLGLQSDGSMQVPQDFGDVGWFTGGGRPGGIGPTIIAGHVDSTSGPAVFFRLKELAVGDVVQVTDALGTVHDYAVYEAGDYPKAAFPTTRVFGATATDELRLITCTGLFDRSVGHYEDNRVVFARPA